MIMEQTGLHVLRENYGSAGIILDGTKRPTGKPVAMPPPATVDVAAIRLSLPRCPYAVTQAEFAQRFGFSPGAVRDWEQGRRKPDGAARMLLSLIRHNHAAIEAVIQDMSAGTSKDAMAG